MSHLESAIEVSSVSAERLNEMQQVGLLELWAKLNLRSEPQSRHCSKAKTTLAASWCGGNRAGKYVVLPREATVFRVWWRLNCAIESNAPAAIQIPSNWQNGRWSVFRISTGVLAIPLSSEVLICCFFVVDCDDRACISLGGRTSTDNEYTGCRRVEVDTMGRTHTLRSDTW